MDLKHYTTFNIIACRSYNYLTKSNHTDNQLQRNGKNMFNLSHQKWNLYRMDLDINTKLVFMTM